MMLENGMELENYAVNWMYIAYVSRVSSLETSHLELSSLLGSDKTYKVWRRQTVVLDLFISLAGRAPWHPCICPIWKKV
jgi:hypothetical protein